jgi:outer membrane protein assembly factor BamB
LEPRAGYKEGVKASPSLLALFLLSQPVISADWPQWRGPDRSGVVKDPSVRLEKIPSDPRVLWQLAVGPGQASPVVSQGVLVFLDGVQGVETAHAIELATGKELWRAEVGPMVEFQNAYGEGPRCTPLVDGDRVYVQSCGGEFRCLGLRDGRQVWAVSFEKQYGATWLGNKSQDPSAKETASRRHGNNGSAVVDGDRIFVPVGSPTKGTLVAFDKKTGRELWAAGTDNTAYSSVMVATLAGVRQAVHFTADALMGVEAESGKVLWREPLKTGAKRHVATPVVDGDTVTVTSTSIGTIRFRISRVGADWKTERMWENSEMKTVIGSPVQSGKTIFTIGPGSRCDLVCLDAATGTSKWKESGLGDYASISVVNDSLLVLDSTGELRLVRASDSKYEELGRAHFAGKTWASPAYADGKLYVKDGAKLTAVQLAP